MLVAKKAASRVSSSRQWLDMIEESIDDELSSASDSSDYSEHTDIEEHLAFLQGFDDFDELQDIT